MQKDFDNWNILKKKTEEKGRPDIHVGDVFWCRMGMNIGIEQDGKNENYSRPVLILKKFSREAAFVVPLTTQTHKGSWYFDLKVNDKDAQAILNQARTVDVKRFERFISNTSLNIVDKIIEALFNLIKER